MIIEKSIVIEQKRLADNVCSTLLKSRIAESCVPGQFVMVGSGSGAHLLRRPISICVSDREAGTIRLVFRTVGYGTNELSQVREGESVDLMGPLGKGFPTNEAADKECILLVAGGIGAPPLYYLSRHLSEAGIGKERITAVLGYGSADSGLFLCDEFKETAEVIISTEDGSAGVRGTVMDAVKSEDIQPDIIFSCGPYPMLKVVKAYAGNIDIPAFISLEERMACGVGACLGCVAKTVKTDRHSRVKNTRVCTEGPVFDAREVEL